MSQSPEFSGARQTCADTVATSLYELERDIERSLARAAGVLVTLVEHREPLGLSVLHGQKLVDDTLKVAGVLGEARASVGALHRTASLTQRQIGVRAVTGNPGDKPDQGTNPIDTDAHDASRVVALARTA